MKYVILFLFFVFYATLIFFLPNNYIVLFAFLINIASMISTKCTIKSALQNLLHFLPFILLTVIINVLLGYYIDAIWIVVKLLLVCNINFIYSRVTPVTSIAKTIKMLCKPLKLFKINTDEIEVLVCISLSMIPILKAEYLEVKMACKAKNVRLNIKNMKVILSKLLISFMKRVNEIDEALVEKGINY